MGLVFHCGSCGARFEVDPKLAGRKARCKSCRQVMTIPSGPREEPALALTPIQPERAAAPRRAAAPAALNWIEAINSQVGLQPLSADAMPAMRPWTAPSPLDDASSSGLYKLASAPSLPAVSAYSGRPAGAITRGYRSQVVGLQRLLRWLNESAYLVSVPFLLLLIMGVILRNRPMALLGATVVILLNIGRLVAGLASVLAVPLRDSPVHAVLFLIPPITFFYAASHWNRLKKPLGRVVGPLLTLAAVLAAFTFVPWLSRGGQAREGTLAERVEQSAAELKQDIRSEVEKAPNLDVNQLKARAADALRKLGPPRQGAEADPATGPADLGPGP